MDAVVYVATLQCHLDHDDVVTHLLLITQFSVTGLWLLMLVAGLWYKEIYLLFVSLALTLDIYLNKLLADVIIQQSAPGIACNNDMPAFSPVYDSMTVYGMPSALAEHVYLFITLALTYALLWRVRLGLLSIFAMLGYAALTCTAQVVLRFNTPWQVVAGAGVGLVYGLLYQLLLYYVLSPCFGWLLSTAVFSYLEYQDRMCSGVSRFSMHGNWSDASSYLNGIIWPLFLCVAAPSLNAAAPLDLVQVKRQLNEKLKQLYSDNKEQEELVRQLCGHVTRDSSSSRGARKRNE